MHLVRLFVIASLFVASCSSQKKSKTAAPAPEMTSVLDSLLNLGFKAEFNPPKDFALLLKESKPQQPGEPGQISFQLLDIKANAVIYMEALQGGKVAWKSDYEVLVQRLAKVDRPTGENATESQIYDIKKRKLIPSETSTNRH